MMYISHNIVDLVPVNIIQCAQQKPFFIVTLPLYLFIWVPFVLLIMFYCARYNPDIGIEMPNIASKMCYLKGVRFKASIT